MTRHQQVIERSNWKPESWEPELENCEKVITLGNPANPITCSMDAALALYPDVRHVGAGSFEEAHEKTLDLEIDAFLVPAAYPKMNDFLMDDRIYIKDINVREIPPLVLCAKPPKYPKRYLKKIFAHPATLPLRSKIEFEIGETVLCGSNEAAALAVFEDSEQTAAISNQLAADMMGLQVLRILRPAAPMGWLLLGRRRADD